MWRTIGFVTYFWPLLFATTIVYLPAGLFRLLGARHLTRRLLETTVVLWCRHMLWMLGARITIAGLENVPRHSRVCVVANHQSYGDTLMIQGYLGKVAGFVAKRELASVPVMSFWMRSMHCVFVERRNPRTARRAMIRGARNIATGHPMVVFPEGTRSRGRPIGVFKAGAFRMAIDSHAEILPVTIDGTADLLERQGYLKSAPVFMTVHPVITVKQYRSMTKPGLAEHVRQIIVAAMRTDLQRQTPGV